MNIRRVLRSIFTFLGILALFPISMLGYEMFAASDLAYSLFGAKDGFASASAFIDLDTNGRHNSGEPPLAGVCIVSNYFRVPTSAMINFDVCDDDWHGKTDSDGYWTSFLANGDCKDIYVAAIPPEGYQSTNTPAASSCNADFGFIEAGTPVNNGYPSIEQFARRVHLRKAIRTIGISGIALGISALGAWWLNKKSE